MPYASRDASYHLHADRAVNPADLRDHGAYHGPSPEKPLTPYFINLLRTVRHMTPKELNQVHPLPRIGDLR